MANSFTNRLTIRGEEDAVTAAVGAFADPGDPDRLIAFERVAPEPDGLHGQELRRWRETHWGCPYAPASATLEHELVDEPAPIGERVYFFTSDGGAPLPILVAFATQHPELEIEVVYHEPADEIAGAAWFKGGRPVRARRVTEYDDCLALLTELWPDELEFWQ